jgi:tetratricopeptide (TPR) repeat protein
MKIPILLLTSLLFAGCIQTIAINTVGGIVEDGFAGFTEESDLEFAGEALPANLKLLEVMLKNDPENERLLRLLSEGYSSYALGFVEDEAPDRARGFYLRAKEYGLRILRQDQQFARALAGSPDDLVAGLRHLGHDDVPAVFWSAFGWASAIYLSISDPDALADLPRVEAMMRFVAEKDSAFYYGGAYLFLGTLYGSRSKFLGGDPELARRYFERALAINEGKFLMTQVYYARSVAVQTLDEELFNRLLDTVDRTSLEVLPEFRLANAIAKNKAKILRAKMGELF